MLPVLPLLGIPSFALALTIALLVGYRVAEGRAAALGWKRRPFLVGALGSLLVAILAGRIHYLLEFGSGENGWLRALLAFDAGGLVLYGCAAAGCAFAALWARRQGWPLLRLGDVLAVPLLVALAIGRCGCFLNGCCYGKPSTLPWAVCDCAYRADLREGHLVWREIPSFASVREGRHGLPIRRHPVPLYEAAVAAALALALARRERGHPWPPCGSLCAAAAAYGTWRFLAEQLRGDNPPLVAPFGLRLTPSALISITLTTTGIAGWWWVRHRGAVAPPTAEVAPSTPD